MEYLYVEFVCKYLYVFYIYILSGAGSGDVYAHSEEVAGSVGSVATALGYSAGRGWRDFNNGQYGNINVTAGGGH